MHYLSSQIPQPENPLYSAASVFINTSVYPRFITLEMIPVSIVGRTWSIFRKIFGEYPYFPNPNEVISLPKSFS